MFLLLFYISTECGNPQHQEQNQTYNLLLQRRLRCPNLLRKRRGWKFPALTVKRWGLNPDYWPGRLPHAEIVHPHHYGKDGLPLLVAWLIFVSVTRRFFIRKLRMMLAKKKFYLLRYLFVQFIMLDVQFHAYFRKKNKKGKCVAAQCSSSGFIYRRRGL